MSYKLNNNFHALNKVNSFLIGRSLLYYKYFRYKVHKKYRDYLVKELSVIELLREIESRANFSNIEIYSYSNLIITLSLEFDNFENYRNSLEFAISLHKREFNKNKFEAIKSYYTRLNLLEYTFKIEIDDLSFLASDEQYTIQCIFNFTNSYMETINKEKKIKIYILSIGKGSINAALDLYLALKAYIPKINWELDIINFSYYKKKEREVNVYRELELKIKAKREEGFEILLFQEDIHQGKSLYLIVNWLVHIISKDLSYKPLATANVVSVLFDQNLYSSRHIWVGLQNNINNR